MHPILDTIMVILFVVFMIFIFGGYHKNKSAKREAEFKANDEKKNKKSYIKASKD